MIRISQVSLCSVFIALILPSCGLPDFTLVLTSPSFVKESGSTNLYTISGTVPNDTDISSYGIEIYYKIYAMELTQAQAQYNSDTATIRNAGDTGVTNSISPPSGFRRAIRSSSSQTVLNTDIGRDITPVIPIALSPSSQWSVNLDLSIFTGTEADGIFVSGSFFSGLQKVQLLRNISVSDESKRQFLRSNISVSPRDEDVSGAVSGTYYVGLITAVYALQVSNGFTNVFSQLVVPSGAGLIDMSSILE